MNERQKRLKEVYEYLRKFYGIHTQSDFANALRKSRNAITLALNGDEKYLTNKLFTNICEVFPGVFNLDYLLTGEGSLLATEEEVHNEEYGKLYNLQPTIDPSTAMNALIAEHVRLVNLLEADIKKKEIEMDERLADKETIIREKDARILSLERTISDKEAIIHEKDARILSLERQLAAAHSSDLQNYPFAIGAAEQQNHPKNSPL
jgi:hypothetical protein